MHLGMYTFAAGVLVAAASFFVAEPAGLDVPLGGSRHLTVFPLGLGIALIAVSLCVVAAARGWQLVRTATAKTQGPSRRR